MDIESHSYSAQLAAIAPELVLLGVALVVLVVDVWTKGKDGKLLANLSLVGLVLVGALLALHVTYITHTCSTSAE